MFISSGIMILELDGSERDDFINVVLRTTLPVCLIFSILFRRSAGINEVIFSENIESLNETKDKSKF